MGCTCASFQESLAPVARAAAPATSSQASPGALSGNRGSNRNVTAIVAGLQQHAAGHSTATSIAPAAGGAAAGAIGIGAAGLGARSGPGSLAHDTVNDFLAECRRGRLDAQADGGYRFNAYARYLGIDPIAEQDLLWVARCALHAPLPEGWTQHYDHLGRVFFYDSKTTRSCWTHPLEQEHRDVHCRLRKAQLSGTCERAAEKAVRDKLAVLEPLANSAQTEWMEHEDDKGQAFYHNRSAQISSWIDPRPALRHRATLWRAALDTLEGRSPQETLVTLLPCFSEEVLDAPLSGLPAWLADLHRRGADQSPDPKFDAWLSPRLLISERAVECPVCYDPLYCARPSVLERLDNGRRLCGHYFCFRCAQRLGGSCPLCRARSPCGCVAKALPNVERAPLAWFRMVDNSANGRLERDEVVRALEAVLPLDAERVRRALGVSGTSKGQEVAPAGTSEEREEASESGWWQQWRSDPAGGHPDSITEEAFCAEGGLLQWIVENLRELRRTEIQGRPPELTADNLQSWFEFWASEPNDGLSRAELLRALMRTLGVSGVERQKIREIRGTIEHCYHVWATEGSNRVTREAFVKSPGGLGEQLVAVLAAQPRPPASPEDERPPDAPPSPPVPPPPFVLPVSNEMQEKSAVLRSGSFQDLLERLSKLRSATEGGNSLTAEHCHTQRV